MCGLAGGIFREAISDISSHGNPIKRMCEAMESRGPDADGYWSTPNFQVHLGHRRLAIVDLDARSNQPFISKCRNYAIVFNGEIYNHKTLREDLRRMGVYFHTESDTEVILNMYLQYGSEMLPKLRGMFAIAIWDGKKNTCFLARDPYGIKPLYLARINGGWLFASQVKALLASGKVSGEIDLLSQAGYWMLGSVQEPRTWFRDISEIPPGSWVEICENGEFSGPSCYWNIGDCWSMPQIDMSPWEVQERVRHALIESVKCHLVSDVPIGIFLSGGIDSGALAGLMVECGAYQLTGVTIAYEEFLDTADDEVPMAAKIAQYYGIKHVVRRVTRSEFKADIPQIMASMDQPSIDGINTWYASKAIAENGLKVVISGVGGDELFLGYDSFRKIPPLVNAAQVASCIPGCITLANMIASIQAKRTGIKRWQHAPHWLQTIGGGWWLRRSTCAPEDLPELMGRNIEDIVATTFTPDSWLEEMVGELPSDPVLALAQIESMAYLRNQLLRDSDWASMAHSVELRTPLVDAHLLKQLGPILGQFKKFPHKTLLANSPQRPLAAEIVNRKKTGFGIPIKNWLTQQGVCTDSWQKQLISGVYKKNAVEIG